MLNYEGAFSKVVALAHIKKPNLFMFGVFSKDVAMTAHIQVPVLPILY